MSQPTCHIDGFGPIPVVRPTAVAELCELVARASADGAAVYPIGGQTQLALGNPPIKAGIAVAVGGLDQVIDFPARDMTITVQAGMSVARLQALLAPENLRLPIDVAAADRATLGGGIAVNASGPRRFGFGTFRDYVIGISAVNDLGREFKGGGRVVKNVAGYDMCKLLVGSLGTLGIITQVTLKLRPLPEEQALVAYGCAADALAGQLDRLHATRTRPVCVDLLNRPAADAVFPKAGGPAPDAAWTLVVGYEGNAAAVHWQVQQLIKEVGAASRLEARVAFTAQPLWDALVDGSGRNEAALAFKANMLPSTVGAFCRSADRDPDRPALQAHAGSGIVRGHWTDGISETRAAELRALWHAEAVRGHGAVVVERCPPAWKRSVPVWDAQTQGWLMRAVKEQFDPRRTFNPGRFVEGL
jgi:glycolate oxidase FAD binding subunit